MSEIKTYKCTIGGINGCESCNNHVDIYMCGECLINGCTMGVGGEVNKCDTCKWELKYELKEKTVKGLEFPCDGMCGETCKHNDSYRCTDCAESDCDYPYSDKYCEECMFERKDDVDEFEPTFGDDEPASVDVNRVEDNITTSHIVMLMNWDICCVLENCEGELCLYTKDNIEKTIDNNGVRRLNRDHNLFSITGNDDFEIGAYKKVESQREAVRIIMEDDLDDIGFNNKCWHWVHPKHNIKEVDWSTVKAGTIINVRDRDNEEWYVREFIAYHDGKVFTYDGSKNLVYFWRYARLIEGDN